jgi:hypothetical protein
MLVILPNHLRTLEGMAMGPPPKILFEFEKDDTFLKHRSLLVKQYERRKILVYMYVLRTHLLHPGSYVFEKRSPERLFIPAIERHLPKDMVGRLYTGSHAPLPRSAHTRFMPPLMRSMTDRATPVREDRNMENAARAPSDPALQIDERTSGFYRQYSPEALTCLAFGNPATVTATTVRGAPSSGGSIAPRHSGGFRSACASKSRLLRASLPSSSALPGTWDKDSPSPSSRTSSALGSAADRLVRPRTSEDGVLEGCPTALVRLGYTPRNRNRSLSTGGGKNERETSPAPRSAKWLGPRPAKVFAAAGLLDRESKGAHPALQFIEL